MCLLFLICFICILIDLRENEYRDEEIIDIKGESLPCKDAIDKSLTSTQLEIDGIHFEDQKEDVFDQDSHDKYEKTYHYASFDEPV